MSYLTLPVSERDHRLGPDGAPAVLVEYGDYECPHCARAHLILKTVRKRLGRSMQFVFRDFPLTSVHPNAEPAAEAAHAAGSQGKFWPMHDALYENQERLGPDLYVALARALELDVPRFVRDVNNRAYLDRVKEDFMSGVRSGVNGTPTFFINGARFDAPWDADTLTEALQLAARSGR